MGLLVSLGLRRRIEWEPRTLLDWFLESPVQGLIYFIYPIILWLRGNPRETAAEQGAHQDRLSVGHAPTPSGTAAAIQKQIDWLASLPHQHKVLVCGNHDSWFDLKSRTDEDRLGRRAVDLKTLHYLERKSVTLTFKGGRRLNVYGAPDIPECGGPEHAFQYTIDQHPWEGTIPLDTDILVTHGPPMFHRDLSVGCPGLLGEIWRKKPKVHIFGHVHWGRGVEAVYWDDCQRAYESLMSRRKRGPIYDMFPNHRWLDATKVLYYASKAILWQWFWLGGVSEGGVLINAAMQAGTSGKLTDKPPITIEI
ncbi:hypothetical protein O1611_g8102 [Lasiodiplodia mahajangana]|uniref:Uncharacterized protein n=1 Tax=Lasiodiplodia mahajangana TaxID=1108764 RepID=A0ACC2JDS1_9PEZI|nr:hypothetical protein O1611_g8102 [Lasiodiplodia mahajangana]